MGILDENNISHELDKYCDINALHDEISKIRADRMNMYDMLQHAIKTQEELREKHIGVLQEYNNHMKEYAKLQEEHIATQEELCDMWEAYNCVIEHPLTYRFRKAFRSIIDKYSLSQE